MDITKLECPGCGSILKENNGKAVCEYCGREIIIHSKKNEIESDQDSITLASASTQLELRRLQITQELSTLQMQLSNIRGEKRSLHLANIKPREYQKQIQQLDCEEKELLSRINLLQTALYPPKNLVAITSKEQAISNNTDNNTSSVPIVKQPTWEPRKQSIVLLLAVFFGYFGIHRFYTGHKKLGVFYLLTVGGFGFGNLIDIILILTNQYKDQFGRPLIPMSPLVLKIIGVLFLGSSILVTWISINPNVSGIALPLSFLIAYIVIFIKSILGYATKIINKPS